MWSCDGVSVFSDSYVRVVHEMEIAIQIAESAAVGCYQNVVEKRIAYQIIRIEIDRLVASHF